MSATIDRDPDLVTAIGDSDPTQGDNANRILSIVGDCVRTTTMAQAFANDINDQANGTLTSDQLACLRYHYSTLTKEQFDTIQKAALEPTQADPTAKQTIEAILTPCSINPGDLTPPGG